MNKKETREENELSLLGGEQGRPGGTGGLRPGQPMPAELSWGGKA